MIFRRISIAGVLMLAAVYFALPARQRSLGEVTSSADPSLRGAIHVHTRRSDGTGTIEQVAAAAAQAGLKFIIVTDHGDATRIAPAAYRSGVLCIDAIEVSTDGGHVIGLGLQRTPYPLAGEPRDVLEDIKRFGGMSIVAHPGSRKPELRWADLELPFDGLEWLNGDSEWRDESPGGLARVLLSYWFRGPESLATLLDRPAEILSRWDTLTRRRQVVAVAGADAHARIALRNAGDPYDNAAALPVPSYEQVFRTFSIGLHGLTLTGDAYEDARSAVNAIRQGHVHSSVDALASPASLHFSGASGGQQAQAGDTLAIGGPVTLRAETNAPADARVTLFKDGERVSSIAGPVLEYAAPMMRATYRIEVNIPGATGDRPVPWIVSNPIYVALEPDASIGETRPGAKEFSSQYENGAANTWAVESSERSSGAIDVVKAVGGTQILMRYALGGAASSNPFVAFVMPAGPMLASYDRLVFTGRASHPMRVSVQLRTPNAAGGERWHRSVYLDESPREITIFFDDLKPRGPVVARRPVLSDVQSVLFVVDQVNTALGSNGQFWIDNVKYGR